MTAARTNPIVVGVSQRVDRIEDRNETRDAVDQRLIQWLVDCGFLPVPIPNSLVSAAESPNSVATVGIESWLEAINPSALVLSGGGDIGTCADRDATERKLLQWAALRRLPMLGICRGMQMMAINAGASLVRIPNHVRTRHHPVPNDSKEIFPATVNSYHELALASCPPGFKVLATVEDGSIEAIAHQQLPWEGWMWHPERDQPVADANTHRLLRMFGK